jgi:RNA polymerase sigma factor (sigma-70 family)
MAALFRRDERAFEQIYKRYAQQVYWYALRFVHAEDVAEDMTQIVFADLWRAPHGWNKTCTLKTYLQVMARNRAIEWWNRKRSLALSLDEEDPATDRDIYEYVIDQAASDQFSEIDERLSNAEKIEQMRAALNRLSATHRRVIYLKYWQDLPGDEIAKVMDCSHGVVRTRLYRALNELRTQVCDSVPSRALIGTE